MGNGHIDDTWQVIRQQPGARNTTAILKGLVNETDVVFHIGDISYARGYANVVSGWMGEGWRDQAICTVADDGFTLYMYVCRESTL